MFKNKKIFIVFLLTVTFLFFINNLYCFGYTDPLINSGTISYTLTDEDIEKCESIADGRPFFIATNNSNSWVVIGSTLDSYFYITDGTFYCSSGQYYFKDLYSATSLNNMSLVNNGYLKSCETAFSYYYTSKDIKKEDDVFFHQSPQGIIATLVEEIQKTGIMGQVMKEILGVLPLIIVVVVSLVGLRKALQMLSMLLHKA